MSATGSSGRREGLSGHLAAASAYAIFGVNIVFCKGIAQSQVIEPIALFTVRAIGASLLFWLVSLFTPREKVALKDIPAIVAASILGLFVPQFTFLKATHMATAIDISILGTLSPIFTMFIAAIVQGEKITFKKALGVAISFAGILALIFNSVHSDSGVEHTSIAGYVLLLVNSLSFSAYLGIFRPLIGRYSVVTFMKWLFLVSLILSLPLSARSLMHTDFANIPVDVALEIAFLVVFATFVAYFLIPVAQKNIRPTLVSMYSYLQPIIAVIISICIGMDVMTWQKAGAIVLVVGGVALVSRSRRFS